MKYWICISINVSNAFHSSTIVKMFDWSIEQFVCGMFRLWTRLTGSRSSTDGSTVCALLLDQHYFTTQTVASLGLAGSVSFYRISLGLGGRGRGTAVFWRPPVAADYDSSPPVHRSEAAATRCERTLDCTLIQNQLRTEETGATSRKQRTAASVYR